MGEVLIHFLGSADLADIRKICEHPLADSKDGTGLNPVFSFKGL